MEKPINCSLKSKKIINRRRQKFVFSKNKPFIIAEAGINHNGSLAKALEMVAVAKEAGADAIKFQTYKASEIVMNDDLQYTYKSRGVLRRESMQQMFKRCEFSKAEWHTIKNACLKRNIIFLSTPQNLSDLEILIRLGVPAVKIGSDDLTNIPMLVEMAKKKLPLILSTGMATSSEIKKTVAALDGSKVVLLVCTSEYPAKEASLNLKRITTLYRLFPSVPIGLSDHSIGVQAASVAAALGACVFEKHFTLDHDLEGPDHWFSADPDELGEWVKAIHTTFVMLGNGLLRPTAAERRNKKMFRRFLVTDKPIKMGQKLSVGDLVARRVAKGGGLSPNLLPNLLGLPVKRSYHRGEIFHR